MSSRVRDLLIAVIFSLTLAHELDAVAQMEWRLLPLLSRLSDGPGRQAFVLVHVPLVAALAWGLFCAAPMARRRTRLGLSGFMAFHVLLHATLERPGVSSFEELPSRAFITLAGLLGTVFLVAELRTMPPTREARPRGLSPG